MPETKPIDLYETHSATHAERASVYISDGMSPEDRESAISMADAFADKNKPVAKTAVLIPVAAHQDGERIVHTMKQYAQQATDESFTVFLHLNAPLDTADPAAVGSAEDNVNKAQELYPNLDIRATTTYYSDATIGRIRRDLWNAAFLLSHHEHGFSTDVIGVNNDIDTHYISPHYLSRIQQYYHRRARRRQYLGDDIANNAVQKSVATRVSHAVLPSHPNTGKVTKWIDNTYFQAPGHIGYEAGIVVPFSAYANLGGFDEYAKTHETAWSNDGTVRPYLCGAHLYTSPRRFIDRLHEHDTSEVWTDDSFSSDDICRDGLSADITHDRAEDVILERLSDDIRCYWLPRVMRPIYQRMELADLYDEPIDLDETISLASDKVEKQLARADRFLRKIVDSALLADILHSEYNPQSYAKTQITSAYFFHKAIRSAHGTPMLRLQKA